MVNRRVSGSAWKGLSVTRVRRATSSSSRSGGHLCGCSIPRSGRPTCVCWRKRRFRCHACGRSFTESRPELPPRQRVTHRFRRHLFARARCGRMPRSPARNGRRATESSAPAGSGHRANWRVARAVPPAAPRPRRGGPPARIAGACRRRLRPDRRRVVEVLDGRSRRTSSATCARRRSARRSRSSRSIPTTRTARRSKTALPGARIGCDPFHLVRGTNTPLDTVRRER